MGILIYYAGNIIVLGCPTLTLLLIDFRGNMLFFLSDLVTYYNSISSQDIDVSAILQIEFPLENTSLWKEKHFEAPNSIFLIFCRDRAAIGC